MDQAITDADLSIVLPAKNEAASLRSLLPELTRLYPAAEILVVDDGSEDETTEVCEDNGVTAISHPYSKGNGAAIKSGVRRASRPYVACMDSDGQHRPADIEKLLAKINEGYDLVVGARGRKSQAGYSRWLGNELYSKIATWAVGHRVEDLTSGFRLFNKTCFREFMHLLPNGFSYPTTSTMAFFRAGYSVGFVPIIAEARNKETRSHIRLLRDGARFLLIIFRIATLYSPLKVFVPISALLFVSAISYYFYTFAVSGSFTNFGAFLAISSVLVFLIGLVSEQITQILYAADNE